MVVRRKLAVVLSFHEFVEGVLNSELKELRSIGLNGEGKCSFLSFLTEYIELLLFFGFQGYVWGGICDVAN